jgi:hypothetical protein
MKVENEILTQIEALEQIFIDIFESVNGFLTKNELKSGFFKSKIVDLQDV